MHSQGHGQATRLYCPGPSFRCPGFPARGQLRSPQRDPQTVASKHSVKDEALLHASAVIRVVAAVQDSMTKTLLSRAAYKIHKAMVTTHAQN